MNFEYIEELVTNCKNGDALWKEKLAGEFRPLIFNISKRTFIDGYKIQDIQNQCYETLFKCVSLYNLTEEEKQLIDFIFYKNNTVQTYAYYKNLCYSTANLKKKVTLMKILNHMNLHYNQNEGGIQ